MSKFKFIKTDDGSTGMYSDEVSDILHSQTGALKESYEKFINPVKDLLLSKNDIKILDICSGIGYNLKAALTLLKNKKAKIDCIDNNKDYVFLSPFIYDNLDDIKIKILILSAIITSGFKIAEINSVISKITSEEILDFFNKDMVVFFDFIYNYRYENIPPGQEITFLHNIYYNYISDSMKEVGKPSDYKDIEIRYKNTDARQFLKNTDCMYDVIFLDGFSPQKDPTLWTFDFIKLISEIMNEDSVLVSYSKSTPFRSALLSLGFYVGKTILHNFEIGTIASFNPSYIKHFLSESDFKIICSRSGICYRDPDCTLSRSQIINQRNILQMNSNRVSRTYLEKCL